MENLKEALLYLTYGATRLYWQLLLRIPFVARRIEIRAALHDALLAVKMKELFSKNDCY